MGEDADNTAIMGPAGIVHMTLEDLCTYATEHLRGELGKDGLLTAETHKQLHTPELNNYACGWVKNEARSEELPPMYWHNGSNTMWYALVVFIPEKNMSVAVTSNDGDIAKAEAAAWEIVTAQAVEATALADPGAVDPKRLEGRYQLNPNFIFDVRHDNGRLMVGITNQPTQEVFADSPTKWSYRSVDATLEFHLRSKGPAYALTLHQNGAAQRAKRVPEPGQRNPRQGAAFPKTSPFTAVRWQKTQPEVKVGKSRRWFTLVSIDGIAASDIVAFSQQSYGDR